MFDCLLIFSLQLVATLTWYLHLYAVHNYSVDRSGRFWQDFWCSFKQSIVLIICSDSWLVWDLGFQMLIKAQAQMKMLHLWLPSGHKAERSNIGQYIKDPAEQPRFWAFGSCLINKKKKKNLISLLQIQNIDCSSGFFFIF